ncbi:PadR family transcriptional regulator [Corynebacterium ulcerans]|nr:PadR family transcriptional regulator [Corynebacterium ulcerans]OAG69555.1 PadR family transcriptional regulator [Corynebacterium ulcerans]
MARSSGFDSGNLSDAAVHILLALTKPRHGYAVMQFLHDASHGHIDIGPASLYTTLKKLTAASLITEVDTDENRRIYHITPHGHEVLTANLERRRQLIAMSDSILETS